MRDNKDKITTNKIKCKSCGDVIESKDIYDFKIIGNKEEYIEIEEKDLENN